MIESLIQIGWALAGFVFVIGLLVAIHEAGHYYAARFFNIKVLTFSIGFGKTALSKRLGETEYRLAWIPLGGFVKFVDERDESQVIDRKDLPRAFNRQALYKRFLVVLAGPLVNLIFAWFAFTLMYQSGINGFKPIFSFHSSADNQIYELVSIDSDSTSTWQQAYQSLLSGLVDRKESIEIHYVDDSNTAYSKLISIEALDINQPKQNWIRMVGLSPVKPDLQPIIDQVMSGSAAQKAGLKSQDLVLKINHLTIDNWIELVETVQSLPNQESVFTINRGGVILTLPVMIGAMQQADELKGKLGASLWVSPDSLKPYMNEVRYGFVDAAVKGVEHSLKLIDLTLTMLKRMLFGEVDLSHISGPVSIAEFSGKAMQSDWVGFLSFVGLISLSLGVLNLLPIPMLDGGHLAFYTLEAIKGTPVSDSVQLVAQKVGIFLLLTLTFIAIFNDVVRLTNG